MAYVYRLYKGWQGNVLAIPGRAIVFFVLLLLFIIPVINQDPYILKILIFTNVFAIFAASWDFLTGYTGQINLGHGLFFGVSAYSTALLNLKLGLPPWVTIPGGALASVAVGLIAGVPALRVRGVYLALVTLSFPIILTGIIYAFPKYTGGELGLLGVTPLSNSRMLNYYVTLLMMIGSALAMWKLSDAKSSAIRLGIFLRAIREDEITARASGIDTAKYKLLAFAISGFFAGIAGGLYVHLIRVAGPSIFELSFSFQPITWSVFGGVGTISGPIVGVYLLYPFIEFLRIIPELRMLIFPLIIIFVILFMPRGVTIKVREEIERECLRCKVINVITRRSCRACYASLHLEKVK